MTSFIQKHKKRVIFASVVTFIMILLTIGLALTIRYGYLDGAEHYKGSQCSINNCSMSEINCTSNDNNPNNYNICYNIIINYSLVLKNTNNSDNIYTKISQTTSRNPRFCKHIDWIGDAQCYYDDRDIFDSLRLWEKYSTELGVMGIIIFAGFWVIMPIFIGSIVVIWLTPYNNDDNDQERRILIVNEE